MVDKKKKKKKQRTKNINIYLLTKYIYKILFSASSKEDLIRLTQQLAQIALQFDILKRIYIYVCSVVFKTLLVLSFATFLL